MRQEVIQKAPEQAKKQNPNLTGIPTQMKLDFERRSGLSFDDVRVHYNSDKPRKIGALAYTQIPQVHIGPGQERHLRHELGHVVQQKQGIVRPTTWINGLPVNDSHHLEQMADGGFSTAVPLVYTGNSVVQMKKVSDYASKVIEKFVPKTTWGLVIRFLKQYCDNELRDGLEDFDIEILFQNFLRNEYLLPNIEVATNEGSTFRNLHPATSERATCPVEHTATDDPHSNGIVSTGTPKENWYRLGFSSVALFQYHSPSQKFYLVYSSTSTPQEIEWPSTAINAIYTMSVSTCQFIAAYDPENNYILIAHLNACDYIPIGQVY